MTLVRVQAASTQHQNASANSQEMVSQRQENEKLGAQKCTPKKDPFLKEARSRAVQRETRLRSWPENLHNIVLDSSSDAGVCVRGRTASYPTSPALYFSLILPLFLSAPLHHRQSHPRYPFHPDTDHNPSYLPITSLLGHRSRLSPP